MKRLLIALLLLLLALPGLVWAGTTTRHGLMREDISLVHVLDPGDGTIYTALTNVTLTAAVTAIGSINTRALLLTPGTWTLAANVTISANILLWIPEGTTVSINAGVTLTARIHAERYGWKTGEGVVVPLAAMPPPEYDQVTQAAAERQAHRAAGHWVSGSLAATSVSLTHDIPAFTAYAADGRYVSQALTAHTYGVSARSYIYIAPTPADPATVTGGTGCSFGSRSTHLLFVPCTAGSGEPNKPLNTIPMMAVDTDADNITTVTDLRPSAYVGEGRGIDEFQSLSAAVTALGSTARATIVINRRVLLDSSVTITRNLTLKCIPPGLIDIFSTRTLTIQGPFRAHDEDVCFRGAGSVAGLSYVSVRWFELTGDGVADDVAAFNAAVTAGVDGATIVVPAPPTQYRFIATGWALNKQGQKVYYNGRTPINGTGVTNVINISIADVSVYNILVDGGTTGINLTASGNSRAFLVKPEVTNTTNGIYSDVIGMTIIEPVMTQNTNGIRIQRHSVRVYGGLTTGNTNTNIWFEGDGSRGFSNQNHINQTTMDHPADNCALLFTGTTNYNHITGINLEGGAGSGLRGSVCLSAAPASNETTITGGHYVNAFSPQVTNAQGDTFIFGGRWTSGAIVSSSTTAQVIAKDLSLSGNLREQFTSVLNIASQTTGGTSWLRDKRNRLDSSYVTYTIGADTLNGHTQTINVAGALGTGSDRHWLQVDWHSSRNLGAAFNQVSMYGLVIGVTTDGTSWFVVSYTLGTVNASITSVTISAAGVVTITFNTTQVMTQNTHVPNVTLDYFKANTSP